MAQTFKYFGIMPQITFLPLFTVAKFINEFKLVGEFMVIVNYFHVKIGYIGWANKKQTNFKLPPFQKFFMSFLKIFSISSITQGDSVENEGNWTSSSEDMPILGNLVENPVNSL